MAVSAIVAVGAAYTGNRMNAAARKQATATRTAAELQAATDTKLAEEQTKQTEAIAAQQRDAEAARAAAQAKAQEEAATEQRRQLAESDTAGLADNTPNVQLAAGDAGMPDDQRKRRASFRPEYATGIAI
jgi:hypothetical protein